MDVFSPQSRQPRVYDKIALFGSGPAPLGGYHLA
jgi:hypothetical protein